MQKYMISLFLVCVMNSNVMGMQLFKKLYNNKKHLSRSVSSTYYDGCPKLDNRPTTFAISQLSITIKLLEHEKKTLEDKGIHDLSDQNTIDRYRKIEMYQDSIERNKDLLRQQLDDLCNPKQNVHE